MLVDSNIILCWFSLFGCHKVFGLNDIPVLLHILLGFLNVLASSLRFLFLMVDPSFWATFCCRLLFLFWYLPIFRNWFEFDDFGSPFAWLLLSCTCWSFEIFPLVLLTGVFGCTINLRVDIIFGMRLIEMCHLVYRNLTLILNDGKIVWKLLDWLAWSVCNVAGVTLQCVLFLCAWIFIILYFQKAVIKYLSLSLSLHAYILCFVWLKKFIKK